MTPPNPVERLSLVAGAGRPESLIRQAFDLAGDGLAVLEASGPLARIVLANAVLAEALGVTQSILAGDLLQGWLCPDSAVEAQRAMADAAAGAAPRRVELGLVRADGSSWATEVLLRGLDDGGEASLVVATFSGIDERKAFELAARTLPLEIIGLDRELRIFWINRSAAAAIGRSAEQLVGHPWFDVLPCLAPRRPFYERTLSGEAQDFDQVDLQTRDGQPLTLATSLRPIRSHDGSVTGLMIMTRDAAALERAASGLHGAERRLALLVGKTHDIVTILSRSGAIEYQSPSGQKLTGYSATELQGRSIFEYAHPDDVADLRQRFAGHLADVHQTMTSAAEARFLHKAGGWVWMELIATNAFDDPAVNGLVVVARSIDRRKAAEAQLASQRAQLDFSLDAARIGAWDYDVTSGVHRFDARCLVLVGGKGVATTMTLNEFARIAHPEDLERSTSRMLRHVKGETPWFEIDYRVRVAGEEWRWVYARGRVSARTGNGRVTRVSGVMMGIDEHRRTETMLRDSERRLEMALWGGDMAFLSWDLNSDRAAVSDSWLSLSGFGREEWDASQLTWRERIHSGDRERVINALQDLREGRVESVELEYRYLTQPGDWIWILGRGRVAECDAQGRPTRLFGTGVNVTAQKKMQELLEETQGAASVGGWELNLRNQQLNWTAETFALFETSPAEYTPSLEGAFKLYDADFHSSMQAVMERAIQFGDSFDIEVRARTLRERSIWLRLIGKAERVDGRTVRLYGAKQDITALKDSDHARREAIAVRRALTEHAPDWLVLVDPQLRIQYANRSIRGFTAQSVTGRNSLELLDPTVRKRLQDVCDQVLKTQEPGFVETREKMPWGTWRHFEYSAAPVIQDERSIGLSVRITDVTARKQVEERARTQALVLDTMREGVVLFSQNGDIRLANPAVHRLLKMEAGSLRGSTVGHLGLSCKMLSKLPAWTRGAEQDSPSSALEWLATRADGSELLLEGVFCAVSIDGEPLLIGVLQDVTDRRQLERAIIETSSFEQNRIASDLHDGLGQELTGISLLLRAAMARLREDREAGERILREAVGLLGTSMHNARALAHGLAPAALEHGGLPGALSDLAARVRHLYRVGARFRNETDRALHLDPAQGNHLYRIAQECANNAVRHGHANFITLSLTSDREYLTLQVLDNGSGIRRSVNQPSAGMGLRIMEYRARMLGGTLQITSPPRGGTRIRCTVPLDASVGASLPRALPAKAT